MPGESAALEIVNKLLPTQDRRDVITLDDLVFAIGKLTRSKCRTKYRDIAILKKQLKRLREEVDYEKSA